jgi:transcriptional regulator with XRE-family HTH domain
VRIYNYAKLRGRIREKGLSEAALAARIGIAKSSLSLKLNNRLAFGQNEIFDCAKELDIALAEIPQYFFCKILHDCEQSEVTP